jgi:hypothetical protein
MQAFDEYQSAWPTVGDEYRPQLIIQDGFPIEYNCENILEEGTLTEAVWFIFDYEVTLKDAPLGAFPADIRRSFEWSLLWNVAVEIGFSNCSFDGQNSQTAQRLPSLAESGFQVVALGSEKDDVVDTEPAGKIHSHLMKLCFSSVAFSRSVHL